MRSLVRAFASLSMSVKLPAEHNLEFLSLKGGCTGSSESKLSKCNIVGNVMLYFISLVKIEVNQLFLSIKCVEFHLNLNQNLLSIPLSHAFHHV